MTEATSLYVSEALTSVPPRSTYEKLETSGPMMKSSPGDELTRIGPQTWGGGVSEPIAVERKSWDPGRAFRVMWLDALLLYMGNRSPETTDLQKLVMADPRPSSLDSGPCNSFHSE